MKHTLQWHPAFEAAMQIELCPGRRISFSF